MQLIADGIKDLSDNITNYSDQYNIYTLVEIGCRKCQNRNFNIYERAWGEEGIHFSILIECTKCTNHENIFDNMRDGYDAVCIFATNEDTIDTLNSEKILSTGEVRINYAYSLDYSEIIETAEIHKTDPGNLFHSISIESRKSQTESFRSVWDAETA